MRPKFIRSLISYMTIGIQSGIYSTFQHAPFGKKRSRHFDRRIDGEPAAYAPITTALLDHFTTQFNAASCSVASIATVLNAASAHLGLSQNLNITQHQLLTDIRTANWKARVSKSGHNGKRGLPLDLLESVVVECFRYYDIPCKDIKTVPLSVNHSDRRARKKVLLSRLTTLETIGDSLIIAHFNQGVFIKGLHLPHISPVGAFDSANRQVLILDVDPESPSPYWISFDTFLKGMSWEYNTILKRYGYAHGGYIWIRLR